MNTPPTLQVSPYEDLGRWIDAHHPEQIEFLREIVKVPSDTPPGDNAAAAEKAAALLTVETRELIGRLCQALETATPWSLQTTEAAMRAFAEANNLKLGAVAQPLRVALTGRTTSPGIFEVLAVLGREECLARLADQATG